ncbi:Trafficking protein particle complex subunit 9 [Xenotaenia resolanae]|uniref:Trafficking protein particle complex subunit 9 n=1 Tax=Xenotaenia resolanae TaxID=208358 RepID=A0ABV0W7P1_9TELE
MPSSYGSSLLWAPLIHCDGTGSLLTANHLCPAGRSLLLHTPNPHYPSRCTQQIGSPPAPNSSTLSSGYVLVNRKPCDCDVVADCKVGDAVTLKVKLTNMSKNPVGPLTLTVMPYQDYQNGIQNYDLDEAVTFIGSNTFFIDMVKPKESSVCEGALLFLYTGDFYLNIKVQDDSTQRELPLAWFTLPGVHIRAQDTPLQAGA